VVVMETRQAAEHRDRRVTFYRTILLRGRASRCRRPRFQRRARASGRSESFSGIELFKEDAPGIVGLGGSGRRNSRMRAQGVCCSALAVSGLPIRLSRASPAAKEGRRWQVEGAPLTLDEILKPVRTTHGPPT